MSAARARRRLLLVAYHFPPLCGVGAFRPLRLARYLPEQGWDVTVLSVTRRVRLPKDAELEREIPAAVRVVRTPTLEPRSALIALNKLGLRRVAQRAERWLMLPDDQRGWVPFARGAARRLHAEVPFDAVVTTSSPYSAHLVGRALRAAGVRWLADFRDDWTTNPYLVDRYPTRWHLRASQALERAVLTEADRVASVSERFVADLRRGSPGLPGAKFLVLPNGYDPAHFEAIPPRAETFRIVHAGTFYGHHSPDVFLDGVRRAVAEGRVPGEAIELEFVGDGVPADGLPCRVVSTGHLTHREAVRRMQRAAVLLLVRGATGGAGVVTAKVYQYLASGRPILALVPPDGAAGDLLRRLGAGVLVPPDDPAEVAAAVASLYRAWAGGADAGHPERVLAEEFDARRQAADWAAALDQMLRG